MPARAGLSVSDEGASAVEFALVSFVLMLFLVGISQFGFTFMQYLEVVHAAREGARWASIRPGEGIGSVAQTGSVKYRVSVAAPGLSPALSDEDISVTVDGAPRDDVLTDTDSGKPVQVTVTYDSPLVIPPMNLFFPDGVVHLTSSATQMVE
ncbi:MAG: hypothetical protein Kow0056_07600 [Coriobacteriia bacterium]